jgi:hypothetical protein
MWTVLVVLAVLAGLWWLSQAGALFVVSVRHGQVLVLRGRVPVMLLSAIRESVSAPPVPRATIKAVRAELGARLVFSGGIDEDRRQRLRNVFGIFPMSRLRAAPPIARPTLGQILNIAWLAWLLDGWTRPR